MTYRKDPQIIYRQRLNECLNKCHYYAVVEVTTYRIVLSGRTHATVKPFVDWTPGTCLIDVRAELASLPPPLPDSRIKVK